MCLRVLRVRFLPTFVGASPHVAVRLRDRAGGRAGAGGGDRWPEGGGE